jgi:hypothetical protein
MDFFLCWESYLSLRPHKKAKKTKKKKDMDRYQRLKQKVQWEIRQANKKYMEEVSTDYKDNSKKFWLYIKSKGQEWIGVAPGGIWTFSFVGKVI